MGLTDSEEEIVGTKDEPTEHKHPVVATTTDPGTQCHTNMCTHTLHHRTESLADSPSVSMKLSLSLSL